MFVDFLSQGYKMSYVFVNVLSRVLLLYKQNTMLYCITQVINFI